VTDSEPGPRRPPPIDRDELVELASAAVRVPTVNPPGNERALAELFAARLSEGGLETELVSHGAGRASLLARLRGAGERPGLILTGHLDVVGAGDRAWRHDPFGGQVVGERLYGRGSTDMKGALASMAAAALALRRAGVRLGGDLLLAFTAGEEVDSLGALALAEGGHLGGADGLIVGEPTDLEVYVAEKGNVTVEIRTAGTSAHASMAHLGRNAIYAMADVIAALERHRFDAPPHRLLGRPTLSVGTVRGGTGSNVVPDGCAIEVDVRSLPGQSVEGVVGELEALLADLRHARPDLDARVSQTRGREAVETSADAPLVGEVVAAVEAVTGRRPSPAGVMYATDASVLVPALAVPMAICGPGHRELAHQTDEHVSLAALEQAARVYALVALRRLGPGA
jgi:succinyl-diaminopimelate desuccinylase